MALRVITPQNLNTAKQLMLANLRTNYDHSVVGFCGPFSYNCYFRDKIINKL